MPLITEWVRGQVFVGRIDGADPDQEPDLIPAQGTVTFSASPEYLPVLTGGPNPYIELPEDRVAVFGPEGYVSTPEEPDSKVAAYPGVRLEVSDDPDSSVQGWTWTATYHITNSKRALDPHTFVLLAGHPVDLATVVQVPASDGLGTEQAEALAAAAQASAASSAADAEDARASAALAAAAAQVTDANTAALIRDPITDTAQAVAEATAGKLDTEAAIETFQSQAALDAATAAKVSTESTATNAAVKTIADESSGSKIPNSEKGQPSGVATLDGTGDVPADQLGAVAGLIDAASKVDQLDFNSAIAALFAGYVIAAEPSGGDDTAALNALLASGEGKTVLLKAGRTYKISDALTIPSGVTLDGNGAIIDATATPAGTTIGGATAFRADGTIGNSILISNPIAQWARVITGIATTAGLAAGDLIRVRNFEPSSPGIVTSTKDKGELFVIHTVDSATQITLTTGANTAMGNDGSLVLAKLSPVKDVTLKNLSLIMGGVGSRHNAARIKYARNITFSNVKIDGAEDSGITFSDTWNAKVSGCSIKNCTSDPVVTMGYAVSLEEASKYALITGNEFENCRSFVNGGGTFPASHVDITWNHGYKATAVGFGAHEPCFYWRIAHNTVAGADVGIQFRGQHGTIENNTIIDSPNSGIRIYADEGVTSQNHISIKANTIDKCGSGINVDGAIVTGTSVESVKRNVKITDNEIFNATFDGILVRNFDGATVTGNLVDGALNNGINVTGLSAANPSKNLRLGPNTVKNVSLVGVKLKWINDIDFTVGLIDTAGQQGVLMETCISTNTIGGTIRRSTLNGFRIVGGSGHVLNGGTIKDLGATTDAIVAVTANDVSIIGGIATGTRYGVNVSGCDRVIVANVNASGSFQATKILLDASAVTYKLSGNIGLSSPAS